MMTQMSLGSQIASKYYLTKCVTVSRILPNFEQLATNSYLVELLVGTLIDYRTKQR